MHTIKQGKWEQITGYFSFCYNYNLESSWPCLTMGHGKYSSTVCIAKVMSSRNLKNLMCLNGLCLCTCMVKYRWNLGAGVILLEPHCVKVFWCS